MDPPLRYYVVRLAVFWVLGGNRLISSADMRMSSFVVKEILSADGMRKIEIFRRPDGSYGFEGYRLSDEPRERC